MRILLLSLIPLAICAASAQGSDTLTGRAAIVDGDTLTINRVRVHLYGIDAPEAGQKCKRDNGKSWKCGKAAIEALAELAEGKEVRCDGKGWDGYDRLLAVCHVGETDINAQMVRKGLAWAFVKYAQDYAHLENTARTIATGIWQGTAEPPWKYRAKRWKVAEQVAPKGCPIKGNISKRGRIYHAPWSPWYKRTKVSPEKGERWFCSERDALDAGWRPPRWR